MQSARMGTHLQDCLRIVPPTKGLGSLRSSFGMEKDFVGTKVDGNFNFGGKQILYKASLIKTRTSTDEGIFCLSEKRKKKGCFSQPENLQIKHAAGNGILLQGEMEGGVGVHRFFLV